MYQTNINKFTTIIVQSSLFLFSVILTGDRSMLLHIVVRVRVEDISEAAVDAGDGLPAVQVDVDLGMTQSSASSVTRNLNIILEDKL